MFSAASDRPGWTFSLRLALGVAGLVVVWGVGLRPAAALPLWVAAVVALGAGLQVFTLGLLAEMVTSNNVRVEHTYSLAERLGEPPASDARDAEHPAR